MKPFNNQNINAIKRIFNLFFLKYDLTQVTIVRNRTGHYNVTLSGNFNPKDWVVILGDVSVASAVEMANRVLEVFEMDFVVTGSLETLGMRFMGNQTSIAKHLGSSRGTVHTYFDKMNRSRIPSVLIVNDDLVYTYKGLVNHDI